MDALKAALRTDAGLVGSKRKKGILFIQECITGRPHSVACNDDPASDMAESARAGLRAVDLASLRCHPTLTPEINY